MSLVFQFLRLLQGSCNRATGKCTCEPGWAGVDCGLRVGGGNGDGERMGFGSLPRCNVSGACRRGGLFACSGHIAGIGLIKGSILVVVVTMLGVVSGVL